MQARAVYAVKRGSSIKSRAMAELVLARTYWLVLPQIMSGRRPKTLMTSMGFEGGNWVAEGQKLDVSLFTCLNLRSQLCRLLLETSNWKKASWTRNQEKVFYCGLCSWLRVTLGWLTLSLCNHVSRSPAGAMQTRGINSAALRSALSSGDTE